MTARDDDWVPIGRIGRPHGVRGGVHVHLFNAESELLTKTLCVRAESSGAEPRKAELAPLEVSSVYGPGLVRFQGIQDRDAAALLRGATLHVRRADFPPPTEDEAYLVDLIGARVQREDGSALGSIESFWDNGAQPIAEVRVTKTEPCVAMPFVPGIVVDVNESDGVVIVDPPEGLFDGEPAVASAAPLGKDTRSPKGSS